MTYQAQQNLRSALVASAKSLLGAANYDRATDRNIDAIFGELDKLEDSGAARARADLRARERMAFSNVLRHGRARISPAESDMLGDLRDARILNISEGSGSAGGFFVPQFTIAEVLNRLKFFSAVASACKLIPTETGAAWLWPTVDETAVAGMLLAENAVSPTVDVTFGSVTLNAFKFTSGIVPVSFEILGDTQIDIVAFLMDIFAKRSAASRTRISRLALALGSHKVSLAWLPADSFSQRAIPQHSPMLALSNYIK
jgi:HK97 family phage major capsid protein